MVQSYFIPICAAVFGCITGRFLNICIHRSPNWKIPGSGRRKTPVSMQYSPVKLLTAAAFFKIFSRFGPNAEAILFCLFICVLIVLSFIDFHTMIIPDGCHVCILALAVIRLCMQPGRLPACVIGFFIISAPMLVLAMLSGGFGGGDVKLCAVCGLFLGWRQVLAGVLAGCLAAVFYSICLLFFRKAAAKTAIAFGPFLSLGFFLSLFT